MITRTLTLGLALASLACPLLAQEPKPVEPPKADAAKDAELQEEIAELIEQLGATRYKTRERATLRLIEIGEAAKPALEQALKSEDVEVKARAKRALAALAPKKPVEPEAPAEGDELPRQLQKLFKAQQGGMRIQILGNGRQIQVSNENGVEKIKVTEKGKTTEFSKDKDGKFTVKTPAGKELKFKDEATFKKEQAALHKLYSESKGGGGLARIFVRPGGMAPGPGGAVPPALPKELEKRVQKMMEELQRKLQQGMQPGMPVPPVPVPVPPVRPIKPGKQAKPAKPAAGPLVGKHGLTLKPVSAMLKDHLGIEGGVAIAKVGPGAGAKLGLQAHDVVIAADGQPTLTPAALEAAIGGARQLTVIRKGKRLELGAK